METIYTPFELVTKLNKGELTPCRQHQPNYLGVTMAKSDGIHTHYRHDWLFINRGQTFLVSQLRWKHNGFDMKGDYVLGLSHE